MLIAFAITSNRDDIADAIYDEGLRGSGDSLGAVLWSVSLYFSSPWQLLLIFLGRVDTERPSDWLLSNLAKTAGLKYAFDPSCPDCFPSSELQVMASSVIKSLYRICSPGLAHAEVCEPSYTMCLRAAACLGKIKNLLCSPREKDFSYPVALRATTILLCAIGGTLVASGLSAALGDATWAVSTGLGSCLIAGVYEVGRPDRLTAGEADALEQQYQDFGGSLHYMLDID